VAAVCSEKPEIAPGAHCEFEWIGCAPLRVWVALHVLTVGQSLMGEG
jgi:hypothetical protein